MKLKTKKHYTLNPPETYEIVMRLRHRNRRFGPKRIKEYLGSEGVSCSNGAIRGWIYHNRKPFLTNIITQIPNASKELTSEKAYILGTLCGDGWISTGYRIGLKVIDKDFANYFKSCIENVYKINCSITPTQRKSTNYCSCPKPQYTVSAVSKLVVEDLLKYSNSFKTKEWRVPKPILEASKEIQAQFIKGFADSEGSARIRERNTELTLCSGNLEGLNDVRDMLSETFGIKTYPYTTSWGVFKITCSDYKSLLKFHGEISFVIERKRETLEEGLKRYKRKGIRKYSKDFKQLALELMDQGLTYYQVGKLMETSPANIYGWKKFR